MTTGTSCRSMHCPSRLPLMTTMQAPRDEGARVRAERSRCVVCPSIFATVPLLPGEFSRARREGAERAWRRAGPVGYRRALALSSGACTMTFHAPLALVLGLAAAAVAAPAGARPKPSAPAGEAARWAAWERHEALERESPFHGLAWRSIGPTVQGGRVVDVESIPGNPYGFYVAYATGGVWKTTNNGVSFEPLSDALATMVVGDI